MLPPVLEVVWHPNDRGGHGLAEQFLRHFHGTLFTGLIGGAVEVFVRTDGWRFEGDVPRPIPDPTNPPPNGLQQAQFVAIVPILGNELAAAVEVGSGNWWVYVDAMRKAQKQNRSEWAYFRTAWIPEFTNGTELGKLLGGYQGIAATGPEEGHDTSEGLRCRDLAQGIAQFLSGDTNQRLTAFISHTKRTSAREGGDVDFLIAMVRDVIATTRLREFFDASDLQPGRDWADELRNSASTSALLALRTDLYASREWCQKEVLLAKRHGMPVIILDAMGFGEERGSFLMDHVPRVPIRADGDHWKRRDVYRALNLLVDECLKRVLWYRQHELAGDRKDLDVSWWAPHAPEPVTLAQWLEEARTKAQLPTGDAPLRILHPDPPLGPDERAVLEQMLQLSGLAGKLDVMTPRMLAARGG